MHRTSRAWIPALLIGLLLATAIFVRPPRGSAPTATSVPSRAVTDTLADPHHMSGAHTSVTAQLAAQPEGIRLCVSASLEPFEGAMAQLRREGPGEAAERMRRCLGETIFYHAPSATLAEVDAHTPYISECYLTIGDGLDQTKGQLVQHLVQCLSASTVGR